MPEFLPACFTSSCPNFSAEQQASPINQKLCKGMQDIIADAGGASFLDIFPCPSEALVAIASSDDEVAEQLRHQLGIAVVVDLDGGLD